uniref:Uncharacterized protein n=1 Tax=Cacopsylla melanoneura TaxID=428564 RepID=A0A8D8YL70_9HEMI
MVCSLRRILPGQGVSVGTNPSPVRVMGPSLDLSPRQMLFDPGVISGNFHPVSLVRQQKIRGQGETRTLLARLIPNQTIPVFLVNIIILVMSSLSVKSYPNYRKTVIQII